MVSVTHENGFCNSDAINKTTDKTVNNVKQDCQQDLRQDCLMPD
jgi:hypothetical protein